MNDEHAMTRSEALELAERYAKLGIPSFPIAISWDEAKQKTSKKPINANGHLGASTDVARIRHAFNGATVPAGAVIGVGLHLGPAGIFVLDGDKDTRGDGVAELDGVLAAHEVRDTVRTLTGGDGVHAWLGKGTRHVTNASPYDAIDIRGDEGWVVAPGVTTPWGEWRFDPEHDLFDGAPIADAPGSLLEEIGALEAGQVRTRGVHGGRDVPDGLDPRDAAALEALLELGGSFSHRDNTSLHVTRPGKTAGTSATIGHIGPGVVKVFTPNWPPLLEGRRYDADELVEMARRTDSPVSGLPPEATSLELSPLSPYMIDWSTFFDRSLHVDNWLVEPFIAKGRAHALYAGAKSGKSLLVLSVVAAMATGAPTLRQGAGEPRHVLYLDYEMTHDDLFERLEEFGYGAEYAEAFGAYLHYASLPSIPPLDTIDGGRIVADFAKAVGAELVIIDTTSRAVAGAENDADTFRAFYTHTGLALKGAGIAFMRLDHSGKDQQKGQRGTSAKNDDVDVVWKLIPRDGALRLEPTHRRMSWVSGFDVTMVETDDGLRYVTTEETQPTGTFHVVEILDRLEVDVETSARKVAQMLREAGESHRNDAIRAAVKVRKKRARESGAHPDGDLLGSTEGASGRSEQNPRSEAGAHPGARRGAPSDADGAQRPSLRGARAQRADEELGVASETATPAEKGEKMKSLDEMSYEELLG